MELSADFVAVWAVVAVGKLHAVFQALKCVAVTVWTNLGLTCQYCSPTCTCICQPTCCRYLLYFLKKHFLVCETVTVYWPRGLGLNGMLLGQCPWNHIRLTLPLLQLWGILSSRTSYFFLVLMCEPDLHLSSDEKKLRRFTQGTGILVCGICSCFQWWQAVIMVTVPCPFLSVSFGSSSMIDCSTSVCLFVCYLIMNKGHRVLGLFLFLIFFYYLDHKIQYGILPSCGGPPLLSDCGGNAACHSLGYFHFLQLQTSTPLHHYIHLATS